MTHLKDYFIDLFQQLNFSASWAEITSISIMLIALFILAILAQIITRAILIKVIHRLLEKTKTEWDDFLIKRKVFSALAHLSSAFIIYKMYDFSGVVFISIILNGLVRIYFVIIFTLALVRTANAVNDIYQTTPYAATRPIKGYVQLVQILIIFLATIFVISILINKSPLGLFAGLGAMAAVLLLVFKDSILGFVASIQLSANNMLKPGDWIEMPSHRADGTVIDISLTTVKVQNWDKTITTIPTYALVSESFNNWAGMEESGGRRIKRSISIDMKSVRFADQPLLEKLSHFHLLKDYIAQKEKEISDFNQKLQLAEGDIYNGRRQTNLGIFRYYLQAYLKQNPNIHQEMTFLVRHLQPTEKGIPLEIYVFSKDQRWANYEGIQADIFDHILAIIPEFGLRVYQNPSGNDITEFIHHQAQQHTD
ncbi:mechanosensitive ion channel family protein [Gaoshiqia sediminis]|uniref:Mechanosensing system component YbdG n=1 Tax=Gaoshiqia sediminis TaxID=2986998 RepID=A0AA41Y0W9_9BACT|nr:mechanosensitive ion channel domain-containing protein [Gaoshiqia sediminis]MCW0481424.1 mechanosensitive ion channel family protein [Gaoshiqia sediminis]